MPSRRVALLVPVLLALAVHAPASGAGQARSGLQPNSTPGNSHRITLKTSQVPSKKGSLTLLYGDDHVFGIVPPDGWVVDDTSGLGSKIRVVLYPRGQKWATAPTVMYSNPLHQDPHARKTFAQMIERDIADFRRQSPRGKVESASPIRNVKGAEAQVRYFAADGRTPLTAVAYFEEKELVMLLVLEAKTAAGFHSALPAFNRVVASYQFVGSDIPTPTGPRANR